ncbi:fumarylacetoacetate hydrolase family protein [Bacillus sp. 03113]|uniref:fumarylacetoacetate hydrolase family protein n=1 Tax=Bacillus sp. 03113 TaxID=2578211 RepID=UPI001143A02D|nr:fumarylacetoacetate hydrolase family protein [Bacillus sp. 03113]
MKFVTAKSEDQTFVGLADESGKKILPLGMAEERKSGENSIPSSMIECIELGDAFLTKVEELLQWIEQEGLEEELYLSIESVKLLAPIPRPLKNIFCVGKNYAEHAVELRNLGTGDIPEHILIFTKAPTTVIGPNEAALLHPNATEKLDYEGELAIVIGKKGTAIPKEEAFDYVFGYTIIDDITARDLQVQHKQFFIGKSLDASCPMGPWIVHKSCIENPHQLHIQTKVNGEVRQDSNSKKFMFPIDEIISVLSKGMTLEPGDIIATGTPAGVGHAFNPPKYLKDGDVIEITVEGIGTLVHTMKN